MLFQTTIDRHKMHHVVTILVVDRNKGIGQRVGGKGWNTGLKQLVALVPVWPRVAENKRGLLPFMLSASQEDDAQQTDTTFELLRSAGPMDSLSSRLVPSAMKKARYSQRL